MVDRDLGIVVQIHQQNPRWKRLYHFKSGSVKAVESPESMKIGDFYDFKEAKTHMVEGVTVESSGSGENTKIHLKNLPLLIRPKGQPAIQAWSPLVGVVNQIHPSYKQLDNQVILVQLDWMPLDHYWRLFNVHSQESGLGPDEFAANAPWVPPPVPPKTPAKEKKKERKEEAYYDGVVFRMNSTVATGVCKRGLFEINDTSSNAGRHILQIGSFLHIKIAKGKNESGHRVVTEYAVVNPFFEYSKVPDRKTGTTFRVKTIINYEGKFDIQNGRRIHYGTSEFFGKVYDVYDFPALKISSRSRGLVEAWICEIPTHQTLRLQVMGIRHLSESSRPPKQWPSPPPLPVDSTDENTLLTGFVNRSDAGNVVYCPEKQVEYTLETDDTSMIGKTVAFKLLPGSLIPTDVAVVDTKFPSRAMADGTMEFRVTCSFQGLRDVEGYPLLESPDLGMLITGFANSDYGARPFEHWVIRSRCAALRWEVSSSNPIFTAASTSSHKKIKCFYVGELSGGLPVLFCDEMKERIYDPRGVITKPGEYRLWATQTNGSRWEILDVTKPPELLEEYDPAECSMIYKPTLDEAAAALRRVAMLPAIQDAIISFNLPDERAAKLIDLLFVNPKQD